MKFQDGDPVAISSKTSFTQPFLRYEHIKMSWTKFAFER